ncbi:MAG: hypothetical protein IJU68_05640 [Bacteroidales bacterium]|nr:hypothetical protein [Bacteroidales bacterium]
MHCYNHPDQEAVAQCKHCNRYYCQEEASQFINGICPECQMQIRRELEYAQAQKKMWYRNNLKLFLVSIVIGFVFALLSLGESFGSALFFGHFVGTIVLAWRYCKHFYQKLDEKYRFFFRSIFFFHFGRLVKRFILTGFIVFATLFVPVPLLHSIYRTFIKDRVVGLLSRVAA